MEVVGVDSIKMSLNSDFDQILFNRIIELVAYGTGYKKEKISAQSRLFQDFGLDGIDGYNLLEAVREEFDIDFSTFHFDRHFGPEAGVDIFSWLNMIFFQRDKLSKNGMRVKKVPITVLDLYEAARTKKFPDLDAREKE